MFSLRTLITKTLQNKAPHDILAKVKHRYMYVIREPKLGTHACTHKTAPNYSIFYAPQ